MTLDLKKVKLDSKIIVLLLKSTTDRAFTDLGKLIFTMVVVQF